MSETNDLATATETIERAVADLLVRDPDRHAEALEGLASAGDRRTVPHLLEVLMIHEIADNWEQFGFPEVLRGHSPPRYLELPEARWPGVREAIQSVAEPDFDSPYAWVEWESWYSQQDIDPLPGFDEWKLQLYRSYLPPVGRLLDTEPREFALQDVRWGNCDPSFLAACNEPDFVPGDTASIDSDSEDAETGESDGEAYLEPDDTVFGFTVEDTAYAVPRWVLFPHELANLTVEGTPLSLTYCTLCNAPILYDRRVGDRTLTFSSTGMLLAGNKIMFDEETESLWSQHRGVPIAGEYLESEPDRHLEVRPISQTTWGEWCERHPDSFALDLETGYDFDYGFYEDHVGFFEHYWSDENAIQPGLETDDGELPEKTAVYGVPADDGSTIHVYPVDDIGADEVAMDEIDGRSVIVCRDATDDVAVYESPPAPLERDGEVVVDAEGDRWELTHDGLVADSGEETRQRVPGRHGLFFAFRTQYDEVVVGPSGD